MSVDDRITSALTAIVDTAAAPPVPLSHIRHRMMTRSYAVGTQDRRLAVWAAVAAAAVISILPLVSPAVMQSIEARYRAALQALGGIAPPPAPHTVVSQLKARVTSLKDAQSRVAFTIVPPAGLPNDVVSSKIVVTPTAVYSQAAHAWKVSSPEVAFSYKRASGSDFIIIADAYDPNERLGKYVFEAGNAGPDGRPMLIKHRQFAWRNGGQLMHAVEGPELSAAEIVAIQRVMHGTPVQLRELHAPDHSPSARLRVLPAP